MEILKNGEKIVLSSIKNQEWVLSNLMLTVMHGFFDKIIIDKIEMTVLFMFWVGFFFPLKANIMWKMEL